MSADNWTICPGCVATTARARKAKLHELDESYGKVSKSDWLSMQHALTSVDPTDKLTFREDYEIGVDGDGNFSVDYAGGCSVCHTAFSFTISKKIDLRLDK